jgi:hypothetical protein
MAALARETGAPALFGYVIDSASAVVEAAGPESGAWTTCLGRAAMAAHLGVGTGDEAGETGETETGEAETDGPEDDGTETDGTETDGPEDDGTEDGDGGGPVLEDYFLEPRDAAEWAVAWAAEAGYTVAVEPLLDVLSTDPDPTGDELAENLFFRLLDRLGVVPL